METKKLLQLLQFLPKENAKDIFIKKYPNNYAIEIDVAKQIFNYGGKIKVGDKTTQNITKPEDWVVLECVDRLLTKGYKPQNIQLEKIYPSGHGTSGRLDICVTNDDGTEYLLIECKTYGAEFDKAFTKLKKDGGQLFTYFKFTNQAQVIALYASEASPQPSPKGEGAIRYTNQIIKIEDEYRTGGKDDFYENWNKLTKDNGLFDSWVNAYNFKSKALTLKNLKPIKQEDSGFIFNRFLEILRNNVVSDKGNAFNKIFTLFLCKVYDEKSRKGDDELQFQWLEGSDTDVSFQLRLTELYQKGMLEFLSKTVSDFSDEDYNTKFASLFAGNENLKKELYERIVQLRLEKNNEFAIKEVFDHQSFKENAKVVKQVVELLQGFKIRYNKRQQYLSDFFELLLTTGLKQEAGQFFTPVPIAQFIIKSLPLDKLVNQKLETGEAKKLLPFIIDYAAGSGHFLTESMHEIQRLLDTKKPNNYIEATAKKIKNWQEDHFDWATDYVYGVEKDYRLVKVGKVGCYLHGDGLANVLLSDGLANFKNTAEYKGLLKKTDTDFVQENKQFDIVLSNPPYSVPAFKLNAREYYNEKDFELYNYLTDQSSQIECLFIERTKQLLKDGGIAGIILPSSILSNTGIYSKAREIILQYFNIIAITELGSNTFMATGTNTVVLFLKRQNNYVSINLKIAVQKYFANLQDVTLNGIETPIAKYLNHVWNTEAAKSPSFGGVGEAAYHTLLQQKPNEVITNHEIYKDYKKKIKAKNDKEFYDKLLAIEAEKIYYFILTYNQQIVLVKTGDKDAEKRFLGYEFSFRRGSEGIHPMQRGKNIEDCTQLFDANVFDNPTKASTYIYQAFNGDYTTPIDATLQNNVSRHNLIDMMTWDRVDFEKNISLTVKKKISVESKWEVVKINDICEIGRGRVINKKEIEENFGEYPVYSSQTSDEGIFGYLNTYDFDGEYLTWTTDGIYAGSVFYRNGKFNCTNVCGTLKSKSDKVNMKFLSISLPFYTQVHVVRVANPKLMNNVMAAIQIPLPPLNIQQQIVTEIEALETQENKAKEEVESLKGEIVELVKKIDSKKVIAQKLGEVCEMKAGKFVSAYDIKDKFEEGLYACFGGNGLRGYTTTFTHEGKYPLIGRQGALCGNVCMAEGKFHATEHAVAVTPFKDINVDWLYYQLLNMNLNQYATGTAQPGLSVENLKTIAINVPPITEQQKIVSQIQTIEQQITALQTVINNIPTQKEAVLNKYL